MSDLGFRIAVLALSLAAPVAAADRTGAELVADPETRANALKDVSQHLICQCGCNMILSECSHQSCPFALPERDKIVAALAAGKSGDEIVASYVATFGPTIRATPPTAGSLYDRVAWFAPVGGLVLGLGIVVLYLVRVTRRSPAPGAPATVPGASPDLLRRRVEEEDRRRRERRERPMTVLVTLLCGLAALAWVGLPLWRPASDGPLEDDGALSRLSERREVMYENIRDLDFEYAMGKLTDQDYHEVRREMVEEAAFVLQDLDATSRDQALDRWIETEVAARRRAVTDPGGSGAASRACASCQQPNPVAATFCDGCGARLAAACAGCGARQRPGARFCGDCGKPL